LYWVDAGIVRAIKQQLDPPSAEERGPLFEGWVANLLRSYRDYRNLFDDWSYWAPAEAVQTEVDFLLRRGREWIALETKTTNVIGHEELRGLRAIAELPKLRRRILLHPRGRARITDDGIEIWPVDTFLDTLDKGKI
jgi:predicted AAA+ superfamily ATPase